jgi:hypothetical protein
MTSDAPRWLALLHGALAWLATALLVASAWRAARPSSSAAAPRAPGAALPAAAAVLVLLAAGVGLVLEPAFLHGLRQRLFLHSATLGWLFERKQHLSAGALFLALGAAALAPAVRGPAARAFAPAARRASIAAAALALAAAVSGTLVAARLHG